MAFFLFFEGFFGQDRSFSIFSHILELSVTLGMLLFSYLPWLWKQSSGILENWGLQSGVYTAILFAILDSFRDKLTSVPLSLYSSFVIEERHGFNKKTLWLFLTDEIKSTLIGIVLSAVFIGGIVFIVDNTGPLFYIYLQVFVMALTFLLIAIYPNLISPLFNKFEELDKENPKEKEVIDSIQEVVEASRFPMKKLFKCDGSKRSSHSNAYFFGLGNNKRVVLFDTLLKDLQPKEISAVVCHEIGHWRLNHLWMMLGANFLVVFSVFYFFSFFRENTFYLKQFGFQTPTVSLSLIIPSQLPFRLSWLFLFSCWLLNPPFSSLKKECLHFQGETSFKQTSTQPNSIKGSCLFPAS
jgi:STE24 endopeptidase